MNGLKDQGSLENRKTFPIDKIKPFANLQNFSQLTKSDQSILPTGTGPSYLFSVFSFLSSHLCHLTFLSLSFCHFTFFLSSFLLSAVISPPLCYLTSSLLSHLLSAISPPLCYLTSSLLSHLLSVISPPLSPLSVPSFLSSHLLSVLLLAPGFVGRESIAERACFAWHAPQGSKLISFLLFPFKAFHHQRTRGVK